MLSDTSVLVLPESVLANNRSGTTATADPFPIRWSNADSDKAVFGCSGKRRLREGDEGKRRSGFGVVGDSFLAGFGGGRSDMMGVSLTIRGEQGRG